jgi:hypothetical protein
MKHVGNIATRLVGTNTRKNYGSVSVHFELWQILTIRNDFSVKIDLRRPFEKLIPGWNIDMTKISNPILNNMKTLGLMKLLTIYGGLLCPISLLCMKDLIGLYNKGTLHGGFFVSETIDHNVTSSEQLFYPNIMFSGAIKGCQTVIELCDHISQVSSRDQSAESVFLGDFNSWINTRVNNGQIMLIDGSEIGVKTTEDTPILVDNLMANHYLDINANSYGILIPSEQILSRNKFEWFARLSEKQVLESNTILGNYILLYSAPHSENSVLEPLQMKPNWVGFWKSPLYPGLYGLKPNFLGDNLIKQSYTGR